MSASKTQNYQLHAWAPGDDFLREEFNENFARLDRIYDSVVLGTFIGDGADKREIVLGFKPRLVFLCDRYGVAGTGIKSTSGGLAFPGAWIGGSPAEEDGALYITEQGFGVRHCTYNYTNISNYRFHYLALR